MKGRKRHLIVDTLGLIAAVMVHAANIHDSTGGELLVRKAKESLELLKILFGDAAYRGTFETSMEGILHCTVEIVKRERGLKTFQRLPKRWIVERTFGWLNRYRRLSKDYELLHSTAESVIYWAMINLMLHRLAPE